MYGKKRNRCKRKGYDIVDSVCGRYSFSGEKYGSANGYDGYIKKIVKGKKFNLEYRKD